jgi:4-hydroxythreonine-4-phosphate dehydrogenase
MGQYAALELGVDAVMAAAGRALVTAPIDKAAARAEGLAYTGHTEYLAARAGGVPVAMLMVGPRLRVVLATIHIPLREVPVQLDVAAVCRAGRLLADGLRRHFGVAAPRVGVLGLNPHAGERGLLGDEELRVIAPAMEALRAEHPESSFEGPLPADTAFFAHGQGRYDGLVAMYHDQGLAPFKLVHFQDGVNMTLGLPYVRTSPDHGTAKDIAGQAVADPSSFAAAVRLARGEARR